MTDTSGQNNQGFFKNLIEQATQALGFTMPDTAELQQHFTNASDSLTDITTDEHGNDNVLSNLFSWQGVAGTIIGLIGSKVFGGVFSMFTAKDETSGQRQGLGFLGKTATTAASIAGGVALVNQFFGDDRQNPVPQGSLSNSFSQASLNNASQQSGLDQDTVNNLATEFKRFSEQSNGSATDENKSDFAKQFATQHNGSHDTEIQEQQVLTAMSSLQVAAP